MDEAELREFDIHLPVVRVHYDFRPIKIRVYKNGDENDLGKDINVTRREFKHWVVFLDALTTKLGTTTAVHRLYTVHGERIDHFDELQPKGEYVAVEKTGFISCEYGKCRPERNRDKQWKSTLHADETRPLFLNSAETMDIYLKHEGYGSYTGLPYPFDAVLPKSSSHSALHINSHAHALQLGGSLERLNNVGRPVWNHEEKIKEQSQSEVHLPKLVGLEEAGQEKEVMKPVEQTVSLPPVADKKTEEKEENLENSQTKELSQISSHKSKEEIMETVTVAEANQDKKESTKAEENPPIQVSVRIVEQPEVEEGHIIVPILIPKQVPRADRTLRTGAQSEYKSIANQRTNKPVDSSFDVDLDEVRAPRRGRGVEKIFERSERRIIREFLGDQEEIKPSRNVVQSTSRYKTYLWEARQYDPDFD